MAAVLAVSLVYAAAALTQERLSDKDLEQRIHSPVSTIPSPRVTLDKTSQEKDAKKLSDNVTKSTKALYDCLKKIRKSDPYLHNMLNYASQLEKLQSSVQLDSATSSAWTKARTQLGDIAHAFHVPLN